MFNKNKILKSLFALCLFMDFDGNSSYRRNSKVFQHERYNKNRVIINESINKLESSRKSYLNIVEAIESNNVNEREKRAFSFNESISDHNRCLNKHNGSISSSDFPSNRQSIYTNASGIKHENASIDSYSRIYGLESICHRNIPSNCNNWRVQNKNSNKISINKQTIEDDSINSSSSSSLSSSMCTACDNELPLHQTSKSVSLYYYHYLYNQKCYSQNANLPLYSLIFNRNENVNEKKTNKEKSLNNSALKPILKKVSVKEMRFRNYGLYKNASDTIEIPQNSTKKLSESKNKILGESQS